MSQFFHTIFTYRMQICMHEGVMLCLELLKLNIMCDGGGKVMLPIERQSKIKEIVQEKYHVKISDLSKQLKVSEMTIHRDLKPLIEKGVIIKTFGGVTLANQKEQDESIHLCVFCNRQLNDKLAYRLILENNKIEKACCAHCGLLRHHQLAEKVTQAMCYDFLRHTTISAPSAWFVLDTSIDMGCCQPQVLTFEWKDHAERFVKGFGGKVLPFSQAIDSILEKMNGHHSCSH